MMRSVRLRWIALTVVLLAAAGGCVAADPAVTGSAVATRVSPLTAFERRTPPLRVPHYRTRGTYPQVSAAGLDLGRVNAGLRNVVLAEQRRYTPEALKHALAPETSRLGYTGLFATSTVRRLISASTVVVSALIPLDRKLPGGHAYGSWLSVTVRVPSGSPVHLVDLFARPRQGLQALAVAVRRRLVSSNRCVRDSFKRDQTFNVPPALRYERGLAPTVRNYKYFALTARGLTIGFPGGQVANPGCYRVEATVPYAALRAYWGELGRKLIAGVRQPK